MVCVSVPRSFWEPGSGDSGIEALAADAIACERRRERNVLLPTDQERYARLTQRIEDFAKRQDGLVAYEIDEEQYLELVLRAKDSLAGDLQARNRLLATFFSPDQLADQMELLAAAVGKDNEALMATLESVQAIGGAVLIRSLARTDRHPMALAPNESKSTDLPRRRSLESAAQRPADALIELFDWAAADEDEDKAVNVGSFSNRAIAEALHRMAYRPGPPRTYRMRFQDGSTSAGLRLHSLQARVPPADAQVVRVALVSQRHLELDEQVDAAWFRNRDVSLSIPHAEIEQICFERTARWLSDYDRALDLRVYQTGFPPAVVGFYRGLIDRLELDATPRLAVTPIFVEGKRITGPVWT